MVIKPLAGEGKKSPWAIYIGLLLLIVIVIGAIGGGYLYYQEARKKGDLKESLRQTFSDQNNNTTALYAMVTGYQQPPNKNFVEEFRAWIDGYQDAVSDYALGVDGLNLAGVKYKAALDPGKDGDYGNVTQVCDRENETLRKLNETCQQYEKEYAARLVAMNGASDLYDLQLNRSDTLYNSAWGILNDDANYAAHFSGYRAYLDACSTNISYYNDSIRLVAEAGAGYQPFLKGESYWEVNRTVDSMYGNVTKMQQKMADLRKKIPNVTVNMMDIYMAWDGGYHKSVNFQVENHNYPMKIWNVVVHWKLIDRRTGATRSTADVSVPISIYISNIHAATLKCDENGDYDYQYTISYDY
jgi:hypothetical protein